MTTDLIVVLEGQPIGRISRRNDVLHLDYLDPYVDDPHATTLSLSMPRSASSQGDRKLTPWLWGLLPDNLEVLETWRRDFGVSLTTPFSLLATAIGRDCAGAVQFCPEDELDDLLGTQGSLIPIDEHGLAGRIRNLRSDATSWLGPGGSGQFSLAGAQAKTALRFDDELGWSEPHGAAATTHVIKPAVPGFSDHDLNEHLCLAAARLCGLRAARSTVEAFEDERVIVIERYDRLTVDDQVVRVHQEDLCQALGVHPQDKYQSDGGPSASDVARLLGAALPPTRALEAVWELVDALAFNWLIAGTDAHAKNYSLLHSGPQTRLAPLYDLASMLPYDDSRGHDLKLAMKLGGEYRLTRTDRRSTWPKVAAELSLEATAVLGRVDDLAARVGAAFETAADARSVASIASDLPERLATSVATRADACRRLLS